MSPIGRNMIGLASRFGSIIVKCRPIGVYGIHYYNIDSTTVLSDIQRHCIGRGLTVVADCEISKF